MNKYELAAQIGFFLISKGLNSWGSWSGKLTAKEQRKWFGVYLGKGTIIIDGEQETIEHRISVCYGQDYTHTVILDCKNPKNIHNNQPMDKEVNKFIENLQ